VADSINGRNWKKFVSAEQRDPLKKPFLAIEIHHLGSISIIHDFLPYWKRLRQTYVENSCLVFAFTHMRTPLGHIKSVFNHHLGVEKRRNRRSEQEFIAPYWHNIISCGLRNPALNYFHNTEYVREAQKFISLPDKFEHSKGATLKKALRTDFDFVSDVKDYTGLLAILHTLYNISSCIVSTGKTRFHESYTGEQALILPLDAKLPSTVCKLKPRGNFVKVYNSKLRKMAANGKVKKIDPDLIKDTHLIDDMVYEDVTQLYEDVNRCIKSRLHKFMRRCDQELQTIRKEYQR